MLPMAIVVVLVYIILINPSFYISYNERIENNKIEDELRLDKEIAYEALTSMLHFVNGSIDSPQVSFVQNGVETYFYNDREEAHMRDIRQMIYKGKIICLVSFILGTIDLLLLVKSKQHKLLAKNYLKVLLVEICLVLTTGIAYMIKPIYVITVYHKLFFRGNSWIFNPATDRIIYFFSNGIYARIIIVVSMTIVLVNGILLTGCYHIKKY